MWLINTRKPNKHINSLAGSLGNVMLHLKSLSWAIILFLFSFGVGASVPRECKGDYSIIKDALVELAGSANVYVKKHGELPGVWSDGIYQIVSSSPKSLAIGGNIDPSSDGESIRLTCSDLKANVHTIYSVNIYTLKITKSGFKEVHDAT